LQVKEAHDKMYYKLWTTVNQSSISYPMSLIKYDFKYEISKKEIITK